MKLEFVKVNPVENMTVLVKSVCERKDYLAISEKLMQYNNLYCEQVGFIEGNHLQMMGGEFCGNASRSFAAYLAFHDETFHEEKYYNITCSGYSKPLSVLVRKGERKNRFFAKIAMPEMLAMKEEKILLEGKELICTRVSLEGITHFIVEEEIEKEVLIEQILQHMEKEGYEAFGVMFFEKDKLEMLPYVFVKGMYGVWERSCASGTTALGYYLRQKYKIQKANIRQPGGDLEVSFEKEQIYIDGVVEIVAEGFVYLFL